jgi:hypothetical protein
MPRLPILLAGVAKELGQVGEYQLKTLGLKVKWRTKTHKDTSDNFLSR